MKFESLGSEKLTITQALAEIEAMRREIMVMGANDYENAAIDEIVGSLKSKQIEPEEAVKKAKSILDNKQDYH